MAFMGALNSHFSHLQLPHIDDLKKMDSKEQIQVFVDLMSADMRTMLLLLHFNPESEEENEVIRSTYQIAKDLSKLAEAKPVPSLFAVALVL